MRKPSDEYTATIRGQALYVRFLDERTIRQAAEELLERADVESSVAAMPVPIEEILEGYLHYHLEFDNLLNTMGALGATYEGPERL